MIFGCNQTLQDTSTSTPPDLKYYPAFSTFRQNPLQRLVALVGHRLPLNWIGKRVAGWLRSLLKATSTQPVDTDALGLRMRLHLTDNACERRLMVAPQFFEPGDLAELKSIITPGFRFIDIGANVGTYSLFVARHSGAEAKILAIEPHPTMSSRLQENAALNCFDITTVRTAVSDFTGTSGSRCKCNMMFGRPSE